jgi:hypothetical protein
VFTMKKLAFLSSVILVSLLNASSGFALSQASRSLNGLTLSERSQPVIVADLFRTIDRVLDTVNQEQQRREERARREQAERDRQAQEAARERDRQAQEAARERDRQERETRTQQQPAPTRQPESVRQPQPQQQPSQNRQTGASELVLVYKDENPANCSLVRDGKIEKTCKSFELRQDGDLYYFLYLFEGLPEGVPTLFMALPVGSGPFDTFDTNGTLTGYYFGQVYFGTEARPIEGTCVWGVSPRIHMATCTEKDEGFRLEYNDGIH